MTDMTLDELLHDLDHAPDSDIRPSADRIREAGWALVPAEPTEAMLDAGTEFVGGNKTDELHRKWQRGEYKAMIAAAEATR